MKAVIALAILFVPTLASAQSDPAPPVVSIGARGGVLLTSWNYSEGDEFYERGTDFAVGGFLSVGGRGDRPLSLGVVVDVLFARQRIGDVVIGQDVIRSVVHVPILLKVNAMRLSAGSRVYGLVGPAIDLQTGATFGEVDVSDLYEEMLLSITAGAGLEWGRWSVEGRASWGTQNVAKETFGADLRANSIGILAGFRIR